MANLAFIGLGRMGYPMAGHLARNGHRVNVFNRSHARSQAWAAEHGGTASTSVSQAVTGVDIAFMCVGDDPDIRHVAHQAFPAMKPGSILVDHTTGSATLAAELAQDAASRGLHFVDAPVSGGEAGAQKGQLTVMCAGDHDDSAAAEPVNRAFAKMVRRLGPAGAGQKTKMVNQICIAGLVQALAEGVHFAEKAGLDPDAVIDVISKGAAQSWQMENRWATMSEGKFDFGFAVDWMRKDLGIALDEARSNGARIAATALIDQFYAEVQAMGGNRWDTSSLVARLERDE